MKKLLALILIVVLSLSTLPAFATPLVKSYNFEGFENDEPAQDSNAWTWITLNQYEYWRTEDSQNQTKLSDTWLEPATRTGDVTGTALRFYTKDGTTPYNASTAQPRLYRGNGVPINTESKFSLDWMVEDHNADHFIQMTLRTTAGATGTFVPFKIDLNGKLTSFGVDTGVTITPGEWHNYEMILSVTEGLFVYMDGKVIHTDPSLKCNNIDLTFFFQNLQNDGNGMFKGSAMQIDNLEYEMLSYSGAADPLYDKKLTGLGEATFTEGDNTISASISAHNYGASGLPYLAVLSVYDADGAYVGYGVSAPGSFVAAGDKNATISVSYPEWGTGYSAKAHVLRDWSNLTAFQDVIYTYQDAE